MAFAASEFDCGFVALQEFCSKWTIIFFHQLAPGFLLIDVLAPSSIGINIFFIISGFLIVGSILRKNDATLG
jgi:peptidoglycan/LPS O-acetylase OafA/YrhL